MDQTPPLVVTVQANDFFHVFCPDLDVHCPDLDVHCADLDVHCPELSGQRVASLQYMLQCCIAILQQNTERTSLPVPELFTRASRKKRLEEDLC